MKKELKDYLYLYLGCEVINYPYPSDKKRERQVTGILRCVLDEKVFIQNKDVFGDNWDHLTTDSILSVKPILSPLSDIKMRDIDLGNFIPEYEINVSKFSGGYNVEFDSVHDDGYCLTVYPDGSMYCICKDNNENYPYKGGELFMQFLSKHFDLFGLIEAGLAIDAIQIKKTIK